MNIYNYTNGWISDPEIDDNLQDNGTVFHVADHQPVAIEDPGTSEESVGLWQGNAVGQAAKEMLHAVEHRYPDTFTLQGIQIRSTPYWLSILKSLHLFIKGFVETPVDALAEVRFIYPQILSFLDLYKTIKCRVKSNC
jgi:hypothetical protein